MIKTQLEQNQDQRQIMKENEARLLLTIDDLYEKVQRSKIKGRSKAAQEQMNQEQAKAKAKK